LWALWGKESKMLQKFLARWWSGLNLMKISEWNALVEWIKDFKGSFKGFNGENEL
jgi:hypothetical protein